jgi:hypothetical protein
MTLKIKQQTLIPNLVDAVSTLITEAGAATVTIADQSVSVRRARVTLTNFSISVTAALDYGGSKIVDLPNKNMLILGVEVDCSVVKGGVTNGIVAATALDMAIGTATASSTTLASTMLNIIEKKDIDTSALTVTFAGHSNDNATSLAPFKIADGASSALFMNVSVPGLISANDTLTVTGLVDIYYMDLGKED